MLNLNSSGIVLELFLTISLGAKKGEKYLLAQAPFLRISCVLACANIPPL